MRLDNRSHLIGSILHNTLKRNGMEYKLKEMSVFAVWDDVVGDKIADAAQPDSVRNGIVFVKTKSSTWANELVFFKQDIIKKINDELKSNIIKDIKFITGKITGRPPKAKKKSIADIDIDDIPLSDDERDFIEKTAAQAESAGIEIRKLMSVSLKYTKWKLMNGWKPCGICGNLQNNDSGICDTCVIENDQR